jgi:hypothetical protein
MYDMPASSKSSSALSLAELHTLLVFGTPSLIVAELAIAAAWIGVSAPKLALYERDILRVYIHAKQMSARQIATRQITLSSNAAGVRMRGDSEFTTYLTPAITLDPNVSWGARAVLWYSAPNLVLGSSSRFGYSHLGVDYVVN